MPDAIETAVKTDVTTEVASLKSRMLALESEAAGYVKVHLVYFIGAICLIVGAVAGHVFR